MTTALKLVFASLDAIRTVKKPHLDRSAARMVALARRAAKKGEKVLAVRQTFKFPRGLIVEGGGGGSSGSSGGMGAKAYLMGSYTQNDALPPMHGAPVYTHDKSKGRHFLYRGADGKWFIGRSSEDEGERAVNNEGSSRRSFGLIQSTMPSRTPLGLRWTLLADPSELKEEKEKEKDGAAALAPPTTTTRTMKEEEEGSKSNLLSSQLQLQSQSQQQTPTEQPTKQPTVWSRLGRGRRRRRGKNGRHKYPRREPERERKERNEKALQVGTSVGAPHSTTLSPAPAAPKDSLSSSPTTSPPTRVITSASSTTTSRSKVVDWSVTLVRPQGAAQRRSGSNAAAAMRAAVAKSVRHMLFQKLRRHFDVRVTAISPRRVHSIRFKIVVEAKGDALRVRRAIQRRAIVRVQGQQHNGGRIRGRKKVLRGSGGGLEVLASEEPTIH